MLVRSVNVQKKTKFFPNRCDAYNYITSMSYDANGIFTREVAGLILNDGVLIVPFNNNGEHTANMDAFQYHKTATGLEVIINGVYHEIIQIVHTHPGVVTNGSNPLGFSPENDGKWSELLQKDIQIIMDGGVYLVGMNNYSSFYNLNQIKSPCEY